MQKSSPMMIFLSGEFQGGAIEMSMYDEISIGRNPELSRIVIQDGGVSRLHCVVTYNPSSGRFVIVDKSTSGVLVNNQRWLERGTIEYLNSGDVIRIGGSDNVIKLIAPLGAENVLPDAGYQRANYAKTERLKGTGHENDLKIQYLGELIFWRISKISVKAMPIWVMRTINIQISVTTKLYMRWRSARATRRLRLFVYQFSRCLWQQFNLSLCLYREI